MAPNGHKAASRRSARQSDIISAPEWLKTHGRDEHKLWLSENPSQKLTYEEWTEDKQHLDGLALFYATKNLLDIDTSDDEPEPVEVKSQPRAVRAQSAREPKKKATTNGNGLLRATSSAASSPLANSEETSPSGKRKRKARRKYLSEEIIPSDGDSEEEAAQIEEIGTPAPGPETATPTAPIITLNGRRKSSIRKPRKKPISEETVSPEDEMDDPMAVDVTATPAIASPLPVRSAPKPATAAQSPAPPKKTHILKLSTRRTPKQAPNEEIAREGVDNASASDLASTPIVTVVTEPEVNGNATEDGTIGGDADHDVLAATGSPDPSPASTRRGLRTRRPAQQRPYYHDAQLFEDVEPKRTGTSDLASASPDAPSRRVSVASLSTGIDDELLEALDEETKAILQEDLSPEPPERRAKHFKGKGRAWKKEESDEDEEFTMAKKKAAKAKAKAEQKKRGRPRKSLPSEDVTHDNTNTDAAEKTNTEPKSQSTARSESKEAPKRKRAPARKSALSAEFVQDSSDLDDDDKMGDSSIADVSQSVVSTPPSKKKARARKSEQSAVSTSVEMRTPKDSPNKQKETPMKTKTSISSVQDTDLKEGAGVTDTANMSEDHAPSIASMD